MKILFVIVLTVTSILSGFGVYEYMTTKREMMTELREIGRHVGNRLGHNLVNPLWDFDNDKAYSALLSEMNAPMIHGIFVYEEDGETLFSGVYRNAEWEPVKADEVPEGDFIVTKVEVVRESKTIGHATLLLTDRFIRERLTRTIYEIIIRTVAIDLTIVLVLALFIRRVVMAPLGRIQTFAARVGEGDLTCTIEPGRYSDELLVLKEAMEGMVCSMADQMDEVKVRQQEAEEQTRLAKEAAEQAEEARLQAESARSEGMNEAALTLEGIVARINEATEHISRSIDETGHGASKQSERASETATAMEEMNATVMEVARNASETAMQADEARTKAQEGADIVSQSVEAIKDVDAKTDELTDNMNALNKQAEGITAILGVITDIADQTNLLALNAAIEAARAGEAGRGFAVVADEVRKLAEKTMDATKQVEESIDGIRTGASRSGNTTREADEMVKRATELAIQSGTALTEILELSVGTSSRVASIATAAEEQSATSDEITKSVDEINSITDETARGMEFATREVSDLKKLVKDMEGLVATLKS